MVGAQGFMLSIRHTRPAQTCFSTRSGAAVMTRLVAGGRGGAAAHVKPQADPAPVTRQSRCVAVAVCSIAAQS
jgi:hypothetical protein